MGEVIKFQPRVSDTPDWTGIVGEISKEVSAKITISEETSGKEKIETENLYPASHELQRDLAVAFKLVDEALREIDESIKAERDADLISSDDAIHRLQALLPELFCCRSISDGFGAIINAVYHSIANMHGTPLNGRQLQAVRNNLSRIKTEPFLEFNEAVDEIMSLEEEGFDVEPSHYKYAADMLDE